MNKVKQNKNFYPQARGSLMNRNHSYGKPRTGPVRPKLPIKRISVQYAHVSVSQLLQHHKIRYIQKTHGKGVVRICSRTVAQLQNTAIIIEKVIDENLIEEIGMPLDWFYKMKSLILFIKPVDQNATMQIEKKFRNSGLNFHITVFDVKNPYLKKKAVPNGANKFQNKEIIDKQSSVQKSQPHEPTPEIPDPVGKQVPRKVIFKENDAPATARRAKLKPKNSMKELKILTWVIILLALFYSTNVTIIMQN